VTDRYTEIIQKIFEAIDCSEPERYFARKVTELGDNLLINGMITGYNIADTQYAVALQSDKFQVIYHMYSQYPEHGTQLIMEIENQLGCQMEFEVITRASVVRWDETWEEEPELSYEVIKECKIARSIEYALVIKLNTLIEIGIATSVIWIVATANSEDAIEHSWYTPDVRITGTHHLPNYQECKANFKKINAKEMITLTVKRQLQGFTVYPILINTELAYFIELSEAPSR